MTAHAAEPNEPVEPDDALAAVLRDVSVDQPVAELLMSRLADVHVAHEELRVAEEEMRAQQAQITELLAQHNSQRHWRGQMSALLPIGLCVTDGNGMVVEANPALAAHLGAPLHRLRGKPLSVFLAREDVRQLRAALRSLGSGAAIEARLEVTVQPRRLPPQRAQVFGFPETADHRASAARVQWVLVPLAEPNGELDRDPDDETFRPVTATEDERSDEEIPASQVIGLATSLAELSALPVAEGDRRRLLNRMAALINGAVPGADWVSITVGSPLEPQRLGSDSAEAQAFDGRQVQADEGPCWDAYRRGVAVIADDVTADPRWPALGRLAAAGAVRAVLAVALHEDGRTTGVVNVYSGRVAAFGTAGRRLAELAAVAVAGVLQTVTEREAMQALAANLETALTSRAVIDQAKGMIMARLGVSADDAFARLVKLSSHLNVKVRDLAALVVEGHVDEVLRATE